MTAATTAETSATGAKANTEKAVADVTPTCKSARISEKRARKAKAAAEAAATVGHITPAIATAVAEGKENDTTSSVPVHIATIASTSSGQRLPLSRVISQPELAAPEEISEASAVAKSKGKAKIRKAAALRPKTDGEAHTKGKTNTKGRADDEVEAKSAPKVNPE